MDPNGDSKETDFSKLIVENLVDACLDDQESVSNHLCNIVVSFGRKQSPLVLWTCLSYLQKESGKKLTGKQKCKFMSIIERICQDSLDQTDEELRKLLITFCVGIISSESAEFGEYEKYACNIIVCLGKKYINEVMDKLILRFEPNSLPSMMVMKCLGLLSTANPFGMVPFIKSLLGAIVSMLPVVRRDQLKMVFAETIGQFAESIQEYLSNIERAPDPAVTQSYFATEFNSIFDTLYNDWLHLRDNRLREQVVKALGIISPLLSEQVFNEVAPKLVNSFLPLYRRPTVSIPLTSSYDFEVHHVSQSLHQILECILLRGSPNLSKLQIESIISALFIQVCALPDYQQPSSIRNHNEILRSFATLNQKYSDLLVPWLLSKLESSSEAGKIGSLTILKHLINASSPQIIPRLSSIFKALRRILDDESNRVRKAITQVIVTIAHHGYLDLEGGQSLIKYIIRQCALEPDESESPDQRRLSVFDNDMVTNKDLRAMSDNVMHLLVTTVEDIERVLWPHLFEYLVQPEYVEALPTLCKSLAHMAEKMATSDPNGDQLRISFEKVSHFPRPEALMARLLVIIGEPSSTHTIHALRLMKTIGIHLHANLTLWELEIPNLFKQLIDLTSLDHDYWREQCLLLTSRSLIAIESNEFSTNFAKSLFQQISLYNQKPVAKKFYLISLGTVIKQLNSKEISSSAIDTVFDHVDHGNQFEREGLAFLAGKCAANHLDMVLVKLEKLAEPRRSGGIIGTIMDTMRTGPDLEAERIKASIILCYAYVVKHATSELLLTRLETPILRTISIFYRSSKDRLVQASYIQSIGIIAHSILPENIKQMYVFRKRNDLLSEMLAILKVTSTPNNTCRLAIDSLSDLIKHEPILSDKDKTSVIDVVGRVVYSRTNCEDLLKSFKSLLEEFLVRERSTTDILVLIVSLLKPWLIVQTNEAQREDALDTILHLLHIYYTKLEEWMPYMAQGSHRFESFGTLVGLIISRIFDPIPSIRLKAYQCLRLVAMIGNKLASRSSDDDKGVETLSRLINIRDDFVPEASLEAIESLSVYFVQQFKQRDLSPLPLFKHLLDGMTENLFSCSFGCCNLFHFLIDIYGNELKPEIAELINYLVDRMPYIVHNQTKHLLETIIISIGSHHLHSITDHLLCYPLMWSIDIIQIWLILIADSTLCPAVVERLLEILSENDLVAPHPRKPNTRIATTKPLAAVVALREIYGNPETPSLVIKYFNKVFTSILCVIGSYSNVDYLPADELFNVTTKSSPTSSPSRSERRDSNKSSERGSKKDIIVPVSFAIQTLRNVLIKCKKDKILTSINEKLFHLMEDEKDFPDSISMLARALCTKYPADIADLVRDLTPYLKDPISNRRLIPVAFFCEILSIDNYDQQTLAEPLLQTLLNMLSDSSNVIRKLCIRGLGRHSCLSPELNSKLSNSVLSALLLGLEDKDDQNDDVLLESIQGLTNNLEYMEQKQLKNLCIPIAVRLRALFDKDKIEVRSSAIHAYGKLCEKSCSLLQDVSTNYLIPLIVYFNSGVTSVVEATRYALANFESTISSNDGLAKIFKESFSGGAPVSPRDFTSNLVIYLIANSVDTLKDWVSTLQSYLKSNQSEVQGSAIFILGQIFSKCNEDIIEKEMKIKIITSLLRLLKESRNNQVKIRSAEALSIM